MSRISVVTPFYNTEEYLGQCIESVLGQTLGDFEYVLHDNLSTDASRAIVESYAARDPRIRVTTASEHVDHINNYNTALRNIAPDSAYCKIVQADDWIYPGCLEEMMGLSGDRPAVIGAFRLKGNQVSPSPPDPFVGSMPGSEACRLLLMQSTDLFGSPTTLMYRSDLVRAHHDFFPVGVDYCDLIVCMELLRNHAFAFVPQILSFSRTQDDSIRSRTLPFAPDLLKMYVIHKTYGPVYLTAPEAARRWREVESAYWEFLGGARLAGRPRAFWEFHRRGLARVNESLSGPKMTWGALRSVWHYVSRPDHLLRRIRRR